MEHNLRVTVDEGVGVGLLAAGIDYTAGIGCEHIMERYLYSIDRELVSQFVGKSGVINTLSQRPVSCADKHIVDYLINKFLCGQIALKLTLLKNPGALSYDSAAFIVLRTGYLQ